MSALRRIAVFSLITIHTIYYFALTYSNFNCVHLTINKRNDTHCFFTKICRYRFIYRIFSCTIYRTNIRMQEILLRISLNFILHICGEYMKTAFESAMHSVYALFFFLVFSPAFPQASRDFSTRALNFVNFIKFTFLFFFWSGIFS